MQFSQSECRGIFFSFFPLSFEQRPMSCSDENPIKTNDSCFPLCFIPKQCNTQCLDEHYLIFLFCFILFSFILFIYSVILFFFVLFYFVLFYFCYIHFYSCLLMFTHFCSFFFNSCYSAIYQDRFSDDLLKCFIG